MTATAAQVCRLLTLIAQRALVSPAASDEMKTLLDKSVRGTRTFVGEALGSSRAPDALFSKIGIGNHVRHHDCPTAERTPSSGTSIPDVDVGFGSHDARDPADRRPLFVTPLQPG